MALYYELPVYRDVYKLILMIFECTKDFSKEYKYTLGQDMKRDALQLVRNIYRANKSANKKEYKFGIKKSGFDFNYTVLDNDRIINPKPPYFPVLR